MSVWGDRGWRDAPERIGRIVEDEWLRTPVIRPQVRLDQYQVMPNHLHGIILVGDVLEENECVATESGRMQDAPTVYSAFLDTSRAMRCPPSQTIGAIVRGFKGAATKRIVELLRNPEIVAWQRNYFAHIIRNDNDLERIREYITANPARWADDVENPKRCRTNSTQR